MQATNSQLQFIYLNGEKLHLFCHMLYYHQLIDNKVFINLESYISIIEFKLPIKLDIKCSLDHFLDLLALSQALHL